MKFAPLSSSFMLISILGFVISVFYIFPKAPDWGFTFILMFIVFFLSSMVSMTYSENIEKLHPKVTSTKTALRRVPAKKTTTSKKPAKKKTVKKTKKKRTVKNAKKKPIKKKTKKQTLKSSKKSVKKAKKR